MTDQAYKALAQRIEQGETLPVVEQFLYEREHARREQAPNALQRLAAERQKNPLLESRKWSIA